MRSLLISAALLMAIASTARGQATGAIRGFVLLPDGAPAAGASVVLRGVPGHSVTADSAGGFLMGEVPAGRYFLVGTHEDLNPATAAIAVRPGDTLTVTLRPGRPVELSELAVTATGTRPYVADSATTGSKIPAPLRDIPQTVNVVTEQVIRDRDVTTMRDLADNAPGVTAVAGYTGYGLNEVSYTIRGLPTSYTNTGYRDGFKDFAGVTPRDVVSIERVEFLKGPSSVLYGATGALGGVPNTVTKKPTPTRIAELGVSADEYGQARGTLDLGGSLSADSGIRYRFNCAVERSRNWRPFDAGSYGLSLVPSLEFGAGGRTTVLVSGEYTRRDYRLDPYIPLDAQSFQLPVDRFYGEPGLGLGRAEGFQTQAVLEHALAPGVKLREGLSVLGGSLRNTSVSLDGLAGPDSLHSAATVLRSSSVNTEGSRDYVSQTELQVDRRALGLRHRLLVGVELSREKYYVDFTLGGLDSIDVAHPVYGAQPIAGELIRAKHVEDQLGVYVQELVDIGPRVKAMVGARFDANTTTQYVDAAAFGLSGIVARVTDRHVTPRAGLVYQPDSKLSFFAGWSRSFQPNFSCAECGDPPTFPPEYGEQFEGGVREEIANGRFVMTATVYQLAKKNVLEGVPGDPLGRSFISAEQRSRGVELELQGSPLRNWNLLLIYSSMNAIQLHTVDSTAPSHARLPGAPRQSASLWSTFDLPGGSLKGLELGGGLYLSTSTLSSLASSANPSPLQLPGWHRIDLMAAYQWDRWRTQVNLDNLTNEKYYDAITAFNLALAPRPPRTFSAGMSARF